MNKEELIFLLSKENSTDSQNKENELIIFIKEKLSTLNISFEEQKNKYVNNIFSFKEGKPLFCCHTDSMKLTSSDLNSKNEIFPIEIIEEGNKIKALRNSKKAIIGGDDACGVFILLNLIERYGDDISFAFFSNEETGMYGSRFLIKSTKPTFPYAIVIDRAGDSDICCEQNGYGSIDFETALCSVGEEFGYKPNKGFCSDADVLRNVTSTTNISCGYYKAHSPEEYVIYEDVIKAYSFCEKIIQIIGVTNFEKSEKLCSTYVETNLSNNFIKLIEELTSENFGLISQEDIIKFYKNLLLKKAD